jgi:hypothetical protein
VLPHFSISFLRDKRFHGPLQHIFHITVQGHIFLNPLVAAWKNLAPKSVDPRNKGLIILCEIIVNSVEKYLLISNKLSLHSGKFSRAAKVPFLILLQQSTAGAGIGVVNAYPKQKPKHRFKVIHETVGPSQAALLVPLKQQADRHECFGAGTPPCSRCFFSVNFDGMVQVDKEPFALVFLNQDVPDRNISMQYFPLEQIFMPCP